MFTRKRVNGEVVYNDGFFAAVETCGVDGIEVGLVLAPLQLHIEDTNDTPEDFRRRFPVGTCLHICTITEINKKTGQPSAVRAPVPDCSAERRARATRPLIEDIRRELNRKFPDVDDAPATEHPMTAVGVVLISAIILQTTDLIRLVTFTGYSPTFICAIAGNMFQNKLWTAGGQADAQLSGWLSPDGLITDKSECWDQIEIACGTMSRLDPDKIAAFDPCKVFWEERSLTNSGPAAARLQAPN